MSRGKNTSYVWQHLETIKDDPKKSQTRTLSTAVVLLVCLRVRLRSCAKLNGAAFVLYAETHHSHVGYLAFSTSSLSTEVLSRTPKILTWPELRVLG